MSKIKDEIIRRREAGPIEDDTFPTSAKKTPLEAQIERIKALHSPSRKPCPCENDETEQSRENQEAYQERRERDYENRIFNQDE